MQVAARSIASIIKSVFPVVLSSIVGLLIIEVLLRVAGISYPVFENYDPLRGHALQPGKSGIYDKEGVSFMEINSLGYLDVDHRISKPDGVYRIAVLGDSFTEARNVTLEATYWKKLESMLLAQGKQVEVLNFGIGGYGTAQELITLNKDVLQFSPDLVILGFYPGNDIFDNSRYLSRNADTFRPFYSIKNGKLELDSSFKELSLSLLANRFLLTAIHYSRLLELINQTRRNLDIMGRQSNAQDLPEFTILDPGLAEGEQRSAMEDAWQVTEMLLQEINDILKTRQIEFVVLVVSTPASVHPDHLKREYELFPEGIPYYAENRLGQLGQRLGFNVVTVADSLKELITEQHLYLHGFNETGLGKGHWNETGHSLAAQLLVESESLAQQPVTNPDQLQR